MRAVFLIAVGLIVSGLPSVLLAQPQEANTKGRLEDGRAYRTDADGFRLVDEVAELQVSNDDLRKQVARLEAQLDAQESALQTCTGATSSSATPDCNELVSSLYLKIARMERQGAEGLGTESSSLAGLPPATSCPSAACDFDSAENPYKQELAQVMRSKSEANAEIERLSEQLVERSSELAEKQRQLAALRQESQMQLAQVSKESQEQYLEPVCDYQSKDNPLLAKVAQLETALQRTESRLEQQTARARLARGQNVPAAVNVNGPSAVETARADLQRELRGINSLISTRKSLYDSLRSRNSLIKIQLQQLETQRGMSLDSIRRAVMRMKQPTEAARLQQGLQQIEGLLRQDISVLKRYLK